MFVLQVNFDGIVDEEVDATNDEKVGDDFDSFYHKLIKSSTSLVQ